MKSGTWWDEVREANAFTAPNKPRFEALSFILHSAVQFPGCQRPVRRTLQMQQQIRRHGKKKRPAAPWRAGRRRTNTITVLHNMQGVLKCLTPLSKRSSWAWTVEQSGLDRGQTAWLRQTEPHKSNMTRSLSGRYTVDLHSTPHLNTFSCLPSFLPVCVGFVCVPYLYLLICFSCT